MLTEINILERRINQLKRELVQTVRLTGLNSNATLYCSQKLDELIAIYQKCLQSNNLPKLA
ncbi:aspartyl-phosphate phosphatase Spo0E family protein [Bacillus niameyensis]|uniref:aspartyl-phosphate phosphatase Spo0E family protein n=1 Tax=Bacillus niameyensis TaxID=1522308 RepID=UPI00084119C6|nr:aspartyl-phosphate phosphatase Spo0E family protein [Bacillus niameyensis]